ncbi:META domain-containing protein [Flavobacterium agrisoli]|nr:META domain-containing protein [Flavobacterium agrisoli]
MLFVVSVVMFSCSATKNNEDKSLSNLEGSWQLNYISGPRIAFDRLYPDAKPTIVFNTKENRVSGNNGCNSYSGSLNVSGNTIDFTQPMVATKKMCLNGQQGEQVYMSTLPKINHYSVSEDGKTLTFLVDDVAMMRFEKQ